MRMSNYMKKFAVIKGGKSDGQLALPLEERVREAATNIPLNFWKAYGFTKSSLGGFKDKVKLPSGKDVHIQGYGITLEKAFQGMNNVESLDSNYGVPHSVLVRMNTPEILALYVGINQIKQYSHIPMYSERFDMLIAQGRQNFAQLISALVHLGYNEAGVPKMADEKRGFSKFPIESGELIKRMKDIPPQDTGEFINSLLIPYRNYGQTNKELRYEFRNPFGHDEKRYDSTARNGWIAKIVNFMAAVYNANMKAYATRVQV